MKIKITFSRVYKVYEKELMKRFEGSIYEDDDLENRGLSDIVIGKLAEEIARDALEDEMLLFVDSSKDFFSAKIEKI